MKKHIKIKAMERDKFAIWLAEKMSIWEVARRLERSPSSIKDGVGRNSRNGIY